jgi:hypothetical protein
LRCFCALCLFAFAIAANSFYFSCAQFDPSKPQIEQATQQKS